MNFLLDSVVGYRVYNLIMSQPKIPKMNGKHLKIGELARLTGTGIETLRYYERLGLLDPAGRTAGGYRLFGPEAIERLQFIRKAQSLGFSLAEIQSLINHKRNGENPCSEVRAIVRNRLHEISKKIDQLIAYRDELAAALAEWEKLGEVPGHVCGLIEGTGITVTTEFGIISGDGKFGRD